MKKVWACGRSLKKPCAPDLKPELLCCSQERTPVDEVLGKEFQGPMLAIIESFQTPAPPGALDPEDPDPAMPAQPALR